MPNQTPSTHTTLQLFHHPISGSSRRVAVTVNLLGLPVEHHLVDLRVPEQRLALADINLNRKIPVLIEGDFILWESHAIMQYLCSKVPGQTLYPQAPRARAEVDRWLFWLSAHLLPVIGGIQWERLWKKYAGNEELDPAQVARLEGQLHVAATVLETWLTKHAWVAGEQMTLADLSLASALMYAKQASLPFEPYPHIRAVVERVFGLPEWQATEGKPA